MMRNPRREPLCGSGGPEEEATAELMDCRYLLRVLYVTPEGLVVGCLYSTYGSLDRVEVVLIGPALCVPDALRHCIDSIPVDDVVYLYKAQGYTVAVLDDERGLKAECLSGARSVEGRPLLCLYELAELPEFMRCGEAWGA